MKKLAIFFLFACGCPWLHAQSFVAPNNAPGSFTVADTSGVCSILIDDEDDWLVNKAATLLQNDIEMVTGKQPALVTRINDASNNTIIIGTLSGSSLIKNLVARKKIDVSGINGKWEAFQLQTVSAPFKSIENALVITGNDKRGTAYGVFELSKQIGVSPWYWWADVPAKRKEQLFIRKGVFTYGSPSVQYRGIFINDEAPAFSGWTKEKFGGVNHLVYEKIFELLLRLKANYLWPAMWGNAFNDDDTLNPVLADKWGIVMGTSHHEPMLRAQQEWKRYGKGPWDYTKNDSVLRDFWRKGIENMDSHESIVTMGMRGDGDEPMTQGTAIGLLERIVADQRKILEEVTGKPASETPQLWALYKEVQDYYDKGMRVPDDVTLLLCDDNWGNIRRLPRPGDQPRKGGYGIYYHFDYVGGPRNYKWINTNNLSRVWEQMHLAYEHGVDKIWIVNVGDLKPMELPISFFLDYAWNTKAWNEENITGFYTQWASEQFGPEHAKEIGEILRKYSQYASRRKPELLDANTYGIGDYDEFGMVVDQWDQLEAKAENLGQSVVPEFQDAYFELVLHPVKAFANLHRLYYAVAQNWRYAPLKYSVANDWAKKAKEYYFKDSLLSVRYHTIAGGKWNHMMDQTHIGYTYWQQPPVNKMPAVQYVSKEEEKPTPAIGLKDYEISLVPDTAKGPVFYTEEKVVAINAEHWTRAINSQKIQWKVIPGIGKDGDGITSFPVTASYPLDEHSPHVEYDFYTNSKDSFQLLTYFSPSLNFYNAPGGLRFAVSIDEEAPQIVSLDKEDNTPVWNNWVASNIIIKTTKHVISRPGKHTVKYWMVDAGVILQKLVLDFGGLEPSYLGPRETLFQSKNNNP